MTRQQLAALVREELVKDMRPLALARANKMARGNIALREHLRDVAIEAVIVALNKLTDDVVSWQAFASGVVKKTLKSESKRFIDKQNKEEPSIAMGSQSTPYEFDASDCREPRLDISECFIGDRRNRIARPADTGGDFAMSSECRNLPPDLFEPFKLRYVDRYSLKRTAKKLGITEKTVKDRLRQAADIIAGNTPPPAPKRPLKDDPVERLMLIAEEMRERRPLPAMTPERLQEFEAYFAMLDESLDPAA